jgi:hypothetical protein
MKVDVKSSSEISMDFFLLQKPQYRTLRETLSTPVLSIVL